MGGLLYTQGTGERETGISTGRRTAEVVQDIEPGEDGEPLVPAHADGEEEGGVEAVEHGHEHAPAQGQPREGVQGPVDVGRRGLLPVRHGTGQSAKCGLFMSPAAGAHGLCLRCFKFTHTAFLASDCAQP